MPESRVFRSAMCVTNARGARRSLKKRGSAVTIEQEWNRVRLILEDHQHAGNQISGGCTCGFRGAQRADHLDHITDVLCGAQEEEQDESAVELP